MNSAENVVLMMFSGKTREEAYNRLMDYVYSTNNKDNIALAISAIIKAAEFKSDEEYLKYVKDVSFFVFGG